MYLVFVALWEDSAGLTGRGACIGTGSCAGGGLHGQLGSPGSSQQLPQPTEVSTKRVASFEPLRKSARISSQLSLRCENLTEFWAIYNFACSRVTIWHKKVDFDKPTN